MNESDALQAIVYTARKQISHGSASCAFLVYDLLTTLDEEVEYVWGSANALPKYLYFISRYFGLIGQILLSTNIVPMFYLMVYFIYLLLMITSIEVSLMLRVDALYGKSKKVRLLIGIAFVIEMSTSIGFNIASYPTLFRNSVPFPSILPIRGCIGQSTIPLYTLSWVPILVFETLLFALNTAKCISYGPLDQTPLIYRLFRDGTAYYALIFVIVLVVTVTQFAVPSVASVTAIWSSAMFSYAGCHLLLSVRKAAARRRRLDLTDAIFAQDPHVPVGSVSEDSSDGLYSLPTLPVRMPSRSLSHCSARPRIESIELVPRRISLNLLRDDSHGRDWADMGLRDWGLVERLWEDKEPERKSNDLMGAGW